MRIKKINKEKMIREIEFSIDKMKEASENREKLFYFSGIYGVISRIFNDDFSEDLILYHLVLNTTYTALKGRIDNPDKVIKLPENIFEHLISTTEYFCDSLKNDTDPYPALKQFAVISFSVTGNGYFLYQKGLLKYQPLS